MKNTSLVLLLLPLLFLSGCSDSNESSSPDGKQNTEKHSEQDLPKNNGQEYFISQIDPVYSQSKTFQTCSQNALNLCLESEVLRRVDSQKDITFCDDILLNQNREDCKRVYATAFAKEKNDESLCNVISDEYGKNYCRAEFVIAQAVEEKSIDKCSTLGTLTQNCQDSVISLLIQSEPEEKWCDLVVEEKKLPCLDQVKSFQRLNNPDLFPADELLDPMAEFPVL